ncbi:MAG: Mov34/MPN/PAD-1 family protein [Chloroflexota bacterium]|nr:Mov34/MPN/PAD-1 family protein [Chloroflexota bacterium]
MARRDAAQLIRLAEERAPSEAVGLLGAISTALGMRLRLYPILEAVTGPTGFRVTTRQLAATRSAIRRDGLLLAGCFHTHPTAGPAPSGLDRASMLRLPGWWLIYSRPARRALIVRLRAGVLEQGRLKVVR